MPRKPINYKKAIIYKLVCNDLLITDLYVGHTTDFTNRKKLHKQCSLNPTNSKHNYKVYKMIRDNGGWDNWSMIEIEKYPFNDENEARARERQWYELLDANMNTRCPILYADDKKQYEKKYYVQNKDQISETKKKYREQKKDYLQEKHQCRCGGCFTTTNKSQHSKTKKTYKIYSRK